MKNREITFVGIEYPPRCGGAGIILSDINKIGRYNVIYPKWTSNITLPKVKIVLQILELFLRILFSKKTTAIYINDDVTLIALSCTKIIKIYQNVGFYCHGVAHLRSKSLFATVLLQLMSQQKLSLFTNSHYTKQALIDLGVTNEPIVVHPFLRAVFENFSDNCLPHKCECRYKLKFIYFGRLEENKGVLNVISFFRLINSHVKNSSLTIVGSGRLYDDIRTQIDGDEHIHLMSEKYDLELVKIISEHDVLVHLPNVDESFGMTIIEAMSLGLDVYTWNKGGIIEACVKGGRSFYLHESDSIDKLSDAALNFIFSLNEYKGIELRPIYLNSRSFTSTIKNEILGNARV